MKKLLFLALVIVILPGCSWKTIGKWLDKMEWEKENETIRIVDFLVK
jgi:hypothetical protein